MRYRVKMVEGEKVQETLLTLRHFVAFKDAHGFTIDDCLGQYGNPVRPWEDWLPWVCHHVFDDSGRELADFILEVSSVELEVVKDPDPSGGESGSASTDSASPASSSAPAARGKSSSRSTTTSSKRSGGNSKK